MDQKLLEITLYNSDIGGRNKTGNKLPARRFYHHFLEYSVCVFLQCWVFLFVL